MTVDATDFLPGLIAVQRRAPHPAARATLWLLLGLFAAMLAWICLGKVDIVAMADGKLVPATYLKIVQPAEAGIAKEILVSEGQMVEEGQVLVRMDAAISQADLHAVRTEHETRRLALRRIDAQLANQPLTRRGDESADLFAQTLAQYVANRVAYENQLGQERSTLDKARHELAAAEQVKEKLEQILPHYRGQEAAYLGLGKEGFAGQLMVNDKVRERIEKEQDLKTQLATVGAAKASIANAEQRIRQVTSDYLRQLRAERAEAAAQVERLSQELAKLDHRHELLELKAPQAGTVKDLATHTAGTVVQPGTVLMTLVPSGERLVADVSLGNEDVAFVQEGMTVRVKVRAYPFQKYGTLNGRVSRVAADADDPTAPASRRVMETRAEARNGSSSAYHTQVEVNSEQMTAGGMLFRLAPGMEVSAEIILGDRTLLEYLTSPFQRAFGESARER